MSANATLAEALATVDEVMARVDAVQAAGPEDAELAVLRELADAVRSRQGVTVPHPEPAGRHRYMPDRSAARAGGRVRGTADTAGR